MELDLARAQARLAPGAEPGDLRPLFETIVHEVPGPPVRTTAPLQLQVSNIDHNDFVGRMGIGRIVAGTVRSHKDVVAGMSKAMSGMGYYLVLVFFCAQFIWVFSQSNLGVLLAVESAEFLKAANLPVSVTLVGITLLTTTVNLLIGSASAK